MSLIAFFPSTAASTTTPAPQAETVAAPVVVQTVTVQPVASRTDMLVADEHWTWTELRDYVVAQIESRFGAFPRDSKKEYGIFNRFIKDHGARGVLAAKTAFEVYDGWWNGAPISINRFAKGSDPYFVTPILARLDDASPAS